MKLSPEPMTTALLMHNSIVRIAKWTNFGFTVEQEGGTGPLSMCGSIY